MLFYSWQETAVMLVCAMMIDWCIGDPRWPTHPVIRIGQWIRWVESKLHPEGVRRSEADERWRGFLLTVSTLAISFGAMWLLLWAARCIHPWLGYAVNTWFISTTIAIKGLKDAAMKVYVPLMQGRMEEARTYTGYIVGRNTSELDEAELTRATVETVAENTVDAVVSPLMYAFLGAAPLAMLYRAANTLDSMVGYKNEKYLFFGWASARWDDVMNWVPARLTGAFLVLVSAVTSGCSALRAAQAIRRFARLHPSPNSGIPESAVAGALGIELGGVNVYHGRISERARMGWPLRERRMDDILNTVRLLYGVSILIAGGLLCAYCWTLW
ncbi:adenosylcobinamide-phosphate synthase CbiB [Paenibacillus sp. OAS669]|uniref:adenosylcobinamide-phosphate synthase CbiB n=1 Tax=Paenibacillus sp. OAS669 TaxID=2663821 RepID=UPI001CEF4461|nr:adenosylcobinamide-phosphate synthase CbiB [Paenibacillus sp. OAS669]